MSDRSPRAGKAPATLAEEPRDFFMTLRDIAFWVRSARADAALARHRMDGTPGEAFDRLYDGSEDPYGAELPQFRYQRRKYRALLSMLPNRTYASVLDVGCGIGVFSRALAPYAGSVLGIDVSRTAVARARELSAALPNVSYEVGDIETFDSPQRFSAIVLADVVYYLSSLTDESVSAIASRLASLLEPGGLLLLVNHFFFAIDPPSRMTRRIHDTFRASAHLRAAGERRRAFYLATLLERC
jgi:SAM-dependent methyltransferase